MSQNDQDDAESIDGSEERSGPRPWDPDRSLSWLNLWNRSDAVAEMWASFTQYLAPQGVLREIQWRGPELGQRGSVLMNFGIEPTDSASPSDHSKAEDLVTPSGFMHTLPIFTDESLEFHRTFAAILPWRAPGLMGVIGHPPHDPDRIRLVCNFEMPAPYVFLPAGVMTDAQRERLHLDRFMTDHLLALGQLPFNGRIQDQKPPKPDFVIESDVKSIGVDCIQFARASRRTAHGSFKAIRNAILEEPRERFAHLAGSLIYIWFGDDSYLAKAYRTATERQAIDALLNEMASYHVDPTLLAASASTEPPEKHPGWDARRLEMGATFYGIPLKGEARTRFFASTGFELGMSFSSSDDVESCWEYFSQLVDAHDQPEFNRLLMTFGGPDETGLGYISEELLLFHMLQRPLSVKRPSHVDAVILHSWETGLIAEMAWPDHEDGSAGVQSVIRLVSPGIRPSSIVLEPFESGPVRTDGKSFYLSLTID